MRAEVRPRRARNGLRPELHTDAGRVAGALDAYPSRLQEGPLRITPWVHHRLIRRAPSVSAQHSAQHFWSWGHALLRCAMRGTPAHLPGGCRREAASSYTLACSTWRSRRRGLPH